MSDTPLPFVEYRAPTRFSDLLKIQLWCIWVGARYVWLVIFALSFLSIVLLPFFSDETTEDVLATLPSNFTLFVSSAVVGITLGAFVVALMLLSQWVRGKAARDIRADISAESVKILGDGISLEALWSSLTWAREGRAAYLIKFKSMLVRLPKRGFASGQEAALIQILNAKARVIKGRRWGGLSSA